MLVTAKKSIRQLKVANAKLIAVVFTAMVILIAYFVANSYYNSLAKSKAEVLERLKAIVFTSAWLINGDDHDSLASTLLTKDAIVSNQQNRIYSELHHVLKTVYQTNHLESPLYTIVYYTQDSVFHFIGTSSDQPYYRHSYKNFPKDLLENYHVGGILDSYHDENGKWMSAFAPIKNSKGEVVALLQADEKFEMFITKARSELIQNTILSLVIVLPFSLLMFGYLSNTLEKQAKDQVLLLNQKEEIEAQRDFIEKQNRELDQRVRERTFELETTNKELANFLYHSSHDVQGPIATLKGLESLAIQETKEPLTQEYLLLIRDTTMRLERMVKAIQLVHHIKTASPNLEKVCLKKVIQSSLEATFLASKEKVEINLPEDFIINTDADLLKISLSELIKNSIQYNEGDSCLRIRISGFTTTEAFNLLIEDNGIGILAEVKKDLFTMFKRGSEKSTSVGLGLYITQISLEKMGGTVCLVESNQAGAHFQISLPYP